eukprot:CAMPEP_0114519186 /NCGR_PEP_ID=MMETSP0109-20121206/18862_1 /TAXON_ID=29199 /ORGANISM="Chlorarachnion reptans, Strain CCCM449" /LENGTH=274 /DNA_ID=CAMNT_0001699895 /DNA_START=81 /DNA_END=905 /DNA_ORIENTATION=-
MTGYRAFGNSPARSNMQRTLVTVAGVAGAALLLLALSSASTAKAPELAAMPMTMRTVVHGPALAPRTARIDRSVPCNVGKNHVRRTTLTVEKGDMPQDITVIGPDPLQRKSYYPKLADVKAAKETWFVLDAEDQILGRLASLAATLVMGKWHPLFQPSMNMGGNVVIINADKIKVTGRKYTDKLYKRHVTGRPGSMKTEAFRDLQARIPERILEVAIKGMLPKTRLGREQFKQIHVYAGSEHPHAAQKPHDVTYKISKSPRETFKQDRELSKAN